MYRKFSIGFIIFISAFMLNVSAMSFQVRYERKDDDSDNDPFVIEMTDLHVFKFLKNTYFFDLPLMNAEPKITSWLINDDLGFGNQHEITFKPFLTCQLKFLLIDYIGFYSKENSERTFYYQPKSGI
jgi:hypothetical protein